MQRAQRTRSYERRSKLVAQRKRVVAFDVNCPVRPSDIDGQTSDFDFSLIFYDLARGFEEQLIDIG